MVAQKYSKIVKYSFEKTVFHFIIVINAIYSCDAKLNFQHYYSNLSLTLSFRNHSNMLNCCI